MVSYTVTVTPAGSMVPKVEVIVRCDDPGAAMASLDAAYADAKRQLGHYSARPNVRPSHQGKTF